MWIASPAPLNTPTCPCAKRPSGFDETAHHQLVDFEEVFHLVGVDTFYRLVCRRRAQNLVYFLLRGNHLFSFKNGGDLLFRERVAFDGG